MKILHVITCLADSGGAEKLMEDLLPAIHGEEYEVSCLVFNGTDSKNRSHLEACGVKVYELSRNKTNYYNLYRILQIIPYLNRFDIIHTHLTAPQFFVAIAGLWGTAKLVTTEHNTDNRRRHIKVFKYFDKWCYNRYKRIICCSTKTKETLLDYLPHISDKTVMVNNGVLLDRYLNANPSNCFSADNINIVMVAWFRSQKDHMTVIRALQLLPNRFHVYFVGDGDTRTENENLVIELGLSKRVHFMGQRTDVPELLKASDYIVLSSHYEGLSLSSIEGMASGKPFLASNVDGLSQVVGGAGVLFEEENENDLAKKIMQLHDDRSLYNKIAEQCKKRAMQYDIVTMANGYKKEYNTITKK